MTFYFRLLGVNLLLLFLFSSAKAQNYTPVRPGWTYQYATAEKDTLITLRVNKAYLSGTDSIFQLDNKLLMDIRFNSLTDNNAYLTNVFGKKIIKNPQGDLRFVLLNTDTLLIKTKSQAGSSWAFSEERNITATLTSRAIASVLGQSDSVLTIDLSNGGQILLSKNHGIVSTTTAFEYLPVFAQTQFINFSTLSLDAIKETRQGKYIADPFVINDFKKGDIRGKKSVYWGATAPISTISFQEMVIDKTIKINDTIVYKTERTFTNKKDTVTKYIFISPPPACCYDNLEPYAYERLSYELDSALENRNLVYWSQTLFDKDLERYSIKLMSYLPGGEIGYDATYTVGIGQTYYRGGSIEISSDTTLICFQTTDFVYGDCGTVLPVDDEQLAGSQVNIGPNPAHDHIKVHNAGNATFTFYSNLGETALTGILQPENASIDLSGLNSGLYVLQLQTVNGLIKEKVLVIR